MNNQKCSRNLTCKNNGIILNFFQKFKIIVIAIDYSLVQSTENLHGIQFEKKKFFFTIIISLIECTFSKALYD